MTEYKHKTVSYPLYGKGPLEALICINYPRTKWQQIKFYVKPWKLEYKSIMDLKKEADTAMSKALDEKLWGNDE